MIDVLDLKNHFLKIWTLLLPSKRVLSLHKVMARCLKFLEMLSRIPSTLHRAKTRILIEFQWP